MDTVSVASGLAKPQWSAGSALSLWAQLASSSPTSCGCLAFAVIFPPPPPSDTHTTFSSLRQGWGGAQEEGKDTSQPLFISHLSGVAKLFKQSV